MKEHWRDIKGYEGLYQVSNLGRVKSLPRKGVNNQYRDIVNILIPNNANYSRVTLSNGLNKKQYLVHRLVAEAFIENSNNKRTVNHKDGNKLNNRIENLEWNTHSENLKHSFRKLKRKPSGAWAGLSGEKNPKHWKGKFSYDNPSSKEVAAYHPNGELYKVFGSAMEAGRSGFTFSSVSACARGDRMTHKKLIWKYI